MAVWLKHMQLVQVRPGKLTNWTCIWTQVVLDNCRYMQMQTVLYAKSYLCNNDSQR